MQSLFKFDNKKIKKYLDILQKKISIEISNKIVKKITYKVQLNLILNIMILVFTKFFKLQNYNILMVII